MKSFKYHIVKKDFHLMSYTGNSPIKSSGGYIAPKGSIISINNIAIAQNNNLSYMREASDIIEEYCGNLVVDIVFAMHTSSGTSICRSLLHGKLEDWIEPVENEAAVRILFDISN